MTNADAVIRQLIEAKAGKAVPPDAAALDGLGLDSLDLVELAMAIEAAFGISISDAAASGMRTVDDVVTYVEARAQSPAASPALTGAATAP